MSLTKKFFKALLKQHLGPYLMGEMLCLEQIEAGLGSIKLHDLQFDPQVTAPALMPASSC
jgi:hypothetical protein